MAGERLGNIFANIKNGPFFFQNKIFSLIVKFNKKLFSPNKDYKIKDKDILKHRFFTENYSPNLAMA